MSAPPNPPKPSPSDARIIKKEPLDPAQAKWTSLHLTTYHYPSAPPTSSLSNKSLTWEHSSRPTRPATSKIDGVGIIAILQKPTGPEILLQKQFRPPVGGVCVEVPAGLVDQGEGAEEAAVRELREETGFVGTVAKEGGVGPVMFNDPGFCDTNLQMVYVNIDTSAPENQEGVRKTELEENEVIETFSVKLAELAPVCRRWEAEGLRIDARVGGLAEGIEIARRFGL